MNKTVKTILITVLAVVLIGGGIVVGANWNNWFGKGTPTADVDDNAKDWEGEKETYSGKKNTDTIDIPGFDIMNLKANETVQSVNLHNPAANSCYFKMTLYTPEGTKLWESKLIEPGKGVYDITLNQKLEAGSYENAKLKYECFSMKDQTPLNGAEIKLTLNVME